MSPRSCCRAAVIRPLGGLVFLLASATAGYGQPHLVLSEVALAPSAGEFIELYNPTASTISLSDYYLADNSKYAFLPAGSPALDIGDFIVRFPAGASIGPGQVVVVAVSGAGFSVTYGSAPNFEILGDAPGVPDMLLIAQSAPAGLTNAGEGVALCYWDGQADLVRDVDLMNVGVPSASNRIVGKSGISVDGPDLDALATFYLTDADILPLQATAPGASLSTKRIALEAGHESWSGGNGIAGHDETTEVTTITWDNAYTSPDPGLVNNVAAVGEPSTGIPPVRIYPNPSRGAISIELEAAAFPPLSHVSVYSVTGERVYSTDIRAGGGTMSLQLRPGLYWVRVSGGALSATSKIVVLGRRP